MAEKDVRKPTAFRCGLCQNIVPYNEKLTCSHCESVKVVEEGDGA